MATTIRKSDWQPPGGAVPAAPSAWQPPGGAVPLGRVSVAAHTRTLPGWVKPGLDLLPAIGGGAGGLLTSVGGPLFALGGAGLGGMAGEGLREAGYGVLGLPGAPQSPGPALRSMGLQGATQAAYEGGGRLLGAGASAVGRPLMQWAMRATPEVAKTAIREGITATQGGFQKLMGLIRDSASKTRGLATAAPHTLDPLDLALETEQKLLPEVAKQPNPVPDILRIRKLGNQMLGGHSDPLSAVDALDMRQKADQIARPIHDAIARGDNVGPRQALVARWNKTVADHLRDWLNGTDETTGAVRIPGMAEQNARTAELLRLKDAFPWAASRGGGVTQAVLERGGSPLISRGIGAGVGAGVGGYEGGRYGEAGPGALVGAAAGAALTTPRAVSYASLLLNSPVLQQLLRQAPRGFGAMMPTDTGPSGSAAGGNP